MKNYFHDPHPQLLQDYQFSLTPQRLDCNLKSSIRIDYSPFYNQFTKQYENVVPIFNNDKEPCLPGFILEIDRQDYNFMIQRYKNDHNQKIKEALQKKHQMNVPMPAKKPKYCGVCKQYYDEYLKHINEQDHLIKFKTSKSYQFIQVLAKQPENIILNEESISYKLTKENFSLYSERERLNITFDALQQKGQVAPAARRGRRGREQMQIIKNKKIKLDSQKNTFQEMQQEYVQAQYQFQTPSLALGTYQQKLTQSTLYPSQIVKNTNLEIELQWKKLINLVDSRLPIVQLIEQKNDILSIINSILEYSQQNQK